MTLTHLIYSLHDLFGKREFSSSLRAVARPGPIADTVLVGSLSVSSQRLKSTAHTNPDIFIICNNYFINSYLQCNLLSDRSSSPCWIVFTFGGSKQIAA